MRPERSDGRALRRDHLVAEHLALAESCARRFAGRGEPLDDLVQVAMVGLVKAADRYDPSQGVPFAGFAIPTIRGELQRHFRDATWAVKVPRGAKDLHLRVRAAEDRLTGRLGRPPTAGEVATEVGSDVDQVLDARDAGAAYRTRSTDAPGGEGAAERALARWSAPSDDGMAPEDRLELIRLLEQLPDRQRQIVGLRFFAGQTQAEIAEQFGISQVHVSRLLRSAVRTMRAAASFDAPAPMPVGA